MVDDVGQMLAEAGEQFVARQAGLRGQRIDLIGAQGVGEIALRNRLVWGLAHPRIGGLAMAGLLELPEQVAKPAADHVAGGATCEQAAQSALEDVAKAPTR